MHKIRCKHPRIISFVSAFLERSRVAVKVAGGLAAMVVDANGGQRDSPMMDADAPADAPVDAPAA